VLVVLALSLTLLSACPEDPAPLPLGTEIVLAALNEAHTGNLGGLDGADALCTSQAKAAGRQETYKAFLSASSRDVRYLIGAGMFETIPVLNTKEEQLYPSWREAFSSSSWRSGAYLYAFDGKRVITSSGAVPNWSDGDGWHGSEPDGTVNVGFTCLNWTSAASSDQGANGELDLRQLLKQEIQPCSLTLAVVCVGVGKPPSYGPCPTSGQPCQANDLCAVDPICDDDLQCRPRQVLSCDDHLECTEDSCDGKGGCVHALRSDRCLIGGACFQDGEGDPSGCNRCEVKQNPKGWTPLTTGCQIGGHCYKAGETDPSGCQVCDPAKDPGAWSPRADVHCKVGAGCYAQGTKHPQACAECGAQGLWKVDSGLCLIDDKCVYLGAKDPTGCKECDPTSSQTSWTAVAAACLIDGQCRKQGDKHPQGCALCDPTQSTTSWTPLGTACLIDNACHPPGAKSPGGCGECLLASSQTSWTVLSNECLINNACYLAGALDPVGCSTCTPTASKITWTPVPGCFKIVLAALNEAHTGDLGGVSGADALCAKQAQQIGYGGTFKAFLSASTREVKDLISGASATSLPVLNTLGEQLYPGWNAIWGSATWAAGPYLYSFRGRKVDENTGAQPDWYDARNWTGSLVSGTAQPGQTCQDWTSSSTASTGSSGELDMRRLLYTNTQSCDRTLAVVCVQVGP